MKTSCEILVAGPSQRDWQLPARGGEARAIPHSKLCRKAVLLCRLFGVPRSAEHAKWMPYRMR
jgi:hypothetical protein